MAIVAAPTRHGILCYEEQDPTIGKSLKLYGEWAEEELYLLSFFLHPGAVVVDVGANIGTHALAFSRFVASGGHVIAIEPQECVFNLLACNVLLNDVKHVSCIRALAGQETGMRFSPPHDCASGTSAAVSFMNIDGARPANTGSALVLPLQLIKLDDLVFARCDLIKIDVEEWSLMWSWVRAILCASTVRSFTLSKRADAASGIFFPFSKRSITCCSGMRLIHSTVKIFGASKGISLAAPEK
jgi:FkbM family methyltransferase